MAMYKLFSATMFHYGAECKYPHWDQGARTLESYPEVQHSGVGRQPRQGIAQLYHAECMEVPLALVWTQMLRLSADLARAAIPTGGVLAPHRTVCSLCLHNPRLHPLNACFPCSRHWLTQQSQGLQLECKITNQLQHLWCPTITRVSVPVREVVFITSLSAVPYSIRYQPVCTEGAGDTL